MNLTLFNQRIIRLQYDIDNQSIVIILNTIMMDKLCDAILTIMTQLFDERSNYLSDEMTVQDS